MLMQSIKIKLILWYLLIQTIILACFNYALFINVKHNVTKNIATTLKTVAVDIQEDLLKNSTYVTHLDLQKEEKTFYIKPLFLRTISKDANDTLHVLQTTEAKFAPPIPPKAWKTSSLEASFSSRYGDLYVITLPLGNQTLLQLATLNHAAGVAIEHFLYTLFILNPFILALSSLGGYFIIYRYFEPLKAMLGSIHQITAHDLSLRIPTHKSDDEINQLSCAFNAMLERLETTFETMKAFNTQASHELRTPLTIMRGEIEIALRKERSNAEYKTIMEEQLEQIIRLQSLVEALLFMAEHDTMDTHEYPHAFDQMKIVKLHTQMITKCQKIVHNSRSKS